MTASEETKRPRRTHIFVRDDDDRYVEPLWVSRRLIEEESFAGTVHDPACGFGQIVTAARAAGLVTTGADVSPLSSDVGAVDFLRDRTERDNVIANPPYQKTRSCDLMREFAEHALEVTRRKVAFLVPLARLNAAHWLVRTPLHRVWLLTPRPSIPPYSYLLAGKKPQGGRVDFAWLVWERGFDGAPTLHWLQRDRSFKQR
jgi:hypothetical protein